jgi:general secretion pathway protein J
MRGFTLLELIVVLAIFAVLSVLAYGGLSSVLTARARVADALERTAAVQRGYLRLRNDFQQLRDRPIRDDYGVTQPALLVQHDGTVEFTRSGWRNPLALPRSALERVAYRVEEGRLLRRSWRVLDRGQNVEPVEAVVLDQVEEVAWRFLDAKLEWQTNWPEAASLLNASPTRPPAPPQAVELTLRLKDLGDVRYLFAATRPPPPT